MKNIQLQFCFKKKSHISKKGSQNPVWTDREMRKTIKSQLMQRTITTQTNPLKHQPLPFCTFYFLKAVIQPLFTSPSGTPPLKAVKCMTSPISVIILQPLPAFYPLSIHPGPSSSPALSFYFIASLHYPQLFRCSHFYLEVYEYRCGCV